MNIRMTGNDIRFRVSQQEMKTLLEDEKAVIKSRTDLPNNGFLVYSLKLHQDENPVRFTYDAGELSLSIAGHVAKGYFASLPRREGIENIFFLKNGENICVTLEVDVKR